MSGASDRRISAAGLDDAALVSLARTGDDAAIRELIRRNNQRLFRTARAIVRSDAEAEDVVQETYVKAFTRLGSFEGRAAFSTWLTRIAINAALGRKRRRRPEAGIEAIETLEARGAEVIAFPGAGLPLGPEGTAMRREMRVLLEEVIDTLPDPFRAVFVLREIEELSTEEVATLLGLKAETVKTRLFRAKALLRTALEQRAADSFAAVFPFDGARCARLADRVVAGLRAKERGGIAPAS